MNILKIKILKTSQPTFWYNKHIGETFYACDVGLKDELQYCSEYGVKNRFLFDKNDIKIIAEIKVKSTKIVGNNNKRH